MGLAFLLYKKGSTPPITGNVLLPIFSDFLIYFINIILFSPPHKINPANRREKPDFGPCQQVGANICASGFPLRGVHLAQIKGSLV